jgi:general secretion pathway protein N
MMGRVAPPPHEALLGTAIVVLLALAVWPWARWALHEPGRRPEAAPPAAAAAPALPPLEAFRDIAERPLFSPSRRPSATALAVTPQGLRLEGVLVIGSEKRALIKQADGHIARVGEGETVGEWTVRQIERERVLLVAGDRRLELTPRRAGPPR